MLSREKTKQHLLFLCELTASVQGPQESHLLGALPKGQLAGALAWPGRLSCGPGTGPCIGVTGLPQRGPQLSEGLRLGMRVVQSGSRWGLGRMRGGVPGQMLGKPRLDAGRREKEDPPKRTGRETG